MKKSNYEKRAIRLTNLLLITSEIIGKRKIPLAQNDQFFFSLDPKYAFVTNIGWYSIPSPSPLDFNHISFQIAFLPVGDAFVIFSAPFCRT